MENNIYRATLRGSFIPSKSWKGMVASTYSKVINLTHPSDIIISIVDNPYYMTDYAVTVLDFKPLISGITKGYEFLWDTNGIKFKDRMVIFSETAVWFGVLPENLSLIPVSRIMQVWREFSLTATEEGFSPIITGKTGNFYSRAADKIIRLKFAEAVSSDNLIDFSGLIGLGIGFTPSGDDFITGILFFESLIGIKMTDRDLVIVSLDRTTVGGRTLLRLAVKNSFPAYLLEFGRNLFNPETGIEAAVRDVLMHGSTSGSDTLAGFIWAAENFKKLPETI